MPERTSALTRRLLAPNPGPMTLDGTNTYLIAQAGSDSVVVVDPGPADAVHLAALTGARESIAAAPNDPSGDVHAGDALRIGLILLTHRHADHSEAAAELHRRSGAPVRAIDPAYCIGAPPLAGGEEIEAAGTLIRVIATPGHTDDSACFHLPYDAATTTPGDETPDADREPAARAGAGSVLTGDTVLGQGTTMLEPGNGALAAYLSSLGTLRSVGHALVLPAHGPVLADLARVCDAYLAHRRQRLDEVRSALVRLGADASVPDVADLVYPGIGPGLRFAAELSVRAQLDYLRGSELRRPGQAPR